MDTPGRLGSSDTIKLAFYAMSMAAPDSPSSLQVLDDESEQHMSGQAQPLSACQGFCGAVRGRMTSSCEALRRTWADGTQALDEISHT
jgi:hypothetical protein